MVATPKRKYVVPAVERAVIILQLLAQEPDGLTISQITQRLAVPKSTIFTILTTLKQYRLVERVEETGQFRLGMELFTLGSTVVERLNVRVAAYPTLKRLAQSTGLTTHLGIVDQGEVVYIEKIEGQGPIKISSAVGRRMGIHCTALGKSMLAQLPEAEFQLIFHDHDLPQRTPNTITSLEALRTDLARTRERGYAFDDEENELGIRCLGAPIINHQGEVACAISISGPRDRISIENIGALAQQVVVAAREISQNLGYVPSS
ncbi:MAG TPA: IclR family transcriptional regulator [Anaerolineae bacterium]|nr:IclR family transcriptional regulator [Anaerolineae bacterium]